MSSPLRAFRLVGAGASEALDRVHVHADVLGVVEEDGAVTVWLAGPLPAVPLPGVDVSELPSEVANATATGLERDRVIEVGADLIVRPPWVPGVPGFTGIELVVPRGMAFGSGEHASTQAALRLLHAIWDQPASFADVGTGSGILAAYAHARGCPAIAACDVEEPAVLAARELLPAANVSLGGPESMVAAADCVVANLTASELHGCLPAILAKWTGRSRLLLCGMRDGEVAGILARLAVPPAWQLRVEPFTAVAWPSR